MPETTPEAEVSPEDKLAAAFEKAGYRDSTEEPEEPTEEVVSEESTEEPEAEEATPETEESFEDVEYEGKEYKLPKELKDALLRQKDYTQKTQRAAEELRVAQELKQQAEIQQQFISAHAEAVSEVHALQRQLQQYNQLDWGKLADEAPAEYLKLDRQQRQLHEAFNAAQQKLNGIANEFQHKATEARQKAQAKCVETLKSEIKDFGPELLKKLDETGNSFGFTAQELSQVVDPRMIRVLHAAMQYQQLQRGTVATKKVQTGKPVQVSTSRSANTVNQSTQLKAAKERAQKTGSKADVENFLAQRFMARK